MSKDILYFGAYGASHEPGVASRYILDTLNLDKDFCIRPIVYYGEQVDTTIYQKYEKSINNPEYIIQHCPIDHMAISMIDAKNVAIPTHYCIYDNIDILKFFDIILVDNISLYTRIVKEIKHKNVRLFRYNKPEFQKNTFNLGLVGNTKKFYYIGKYKENQHLLQKIIVSFNLAFRTETNVSLTLFINDNSKYQKELDDYTTYIKKRLKISDLFSKEKIFFNNFSTQEVCTAHNTGDILLDLDDSPYSNIHRHLAEFHDNQVLTFEDIKKIHVPAIDDDNYWPNKIKFSILTQDLVDQMKTVVDSKNCKQKYTSQQTIEQILY